MALRVYHMVYSNSCEEHKYLAGIRREKNSFERLIKERGVSGLHLRIHGLLTVLFYSRCSLLWLKSGEMDLDQTLSSRLSALVWLVEDAN
jgi:hypothetical protein